MPYYVFHNMTAEDADAIVAYLRTVPAVVNAIPQRGASFDVPAPAPALDATQIPMPAEQLPREGRARCAAATSPPRPASASSATPSTSRLRSATVLDDDEAVRGGRRLLAAVRRHADDQPVSKNITSHATSGLGTWTAADIVKVLKLGVAKDGTGICPPMPVGPMGAFGGLTDADATDIANYIKSLPAIDNTIVDMCVFPPGPPPTGAGGAVARGGAAGAGGGAAGGGRQGRAARAAAWPVRAAPRSARRAVAGCSRRCGRFGGEAGGGRRFGAAGGSGGSGGGRSRQRRVIATLVALAVIAAVAITGCGGGEPSAAAAGTLSAPDYASLARRASSTTRLRRR